MNLVSGEVAFKHIREALSDNLSADSFSCEEIAFERFRLAMIDSGLSPLDRAVRLRHALRYADLYLGNAHARRSLPLPSKLGWPSEGQCQACGLRVRAEGSVEASPWKPDWQPGVSIDGVDAIAMRSARRQWLHRSPPADYWLKKMLGFDQFRGPGQALAVRSALHMPVCKTLLVVLPTGEGKSLVFQAIAAAYPKMTVAVVVPTIALALDHAAATRNCQSLAPDHPHAYIGGQNANNEMILDSIESEKQGLVFAAPEAFIGKLRQPLVDAARGGKLAALVIDEAHLVDAWGTDFRSEFQLLSALVAELRAVASFDQQPRIICLSATVTQATLETLNILFSPGEPISIVPAARLRPEPDIWVAPVSKSESERERRVIDALHHLPRPAVLYVTKPDEAEKWRDKLCEIGFKRIATVHGGTDTANRTKVVDSWRNGLLDLVVGTSAFGLGIDYAHVRTVIHACVPESLDRYYQEVGRSGRDNRASIALLISDDSDFSVAKKLSTKKIISGKKGLARWRAMFSTAVHDETVLTRFLVNPASRVAYNPDMGGDWHADWNGRVLNLMSHSGLIWLSGLKYDQAAKRTLVAIDIINDGHADTATWETRVEPVRKQLLKASRKTFVDMCRLIENNACPSTLFCELYRLHHFDRDWGVVSACGGCSYCRASRGEGWFADWPNAPTAPWPIGGLDKRLLKCCDNGRCFVERDTDALDKGRHRRWIKDIINGLWNCGVHKCIILGSPPEVLHEVLSTRPWCVAQGQDCTLLSSNGFPHGPEFVWVAPGHMPEAHHLLPLQVGDERIFLLPPDSNDPANPGRPLADRFSLLSIASFHNRLLT